MRVVGKETAKQNLNLAEVLECHSRVWHFPGVIDPINTIIWK